MIIYLLLILLNLILLHLCLRYNRNARYYNKIPGPKPLPFLGNLLLMYGSLEHLWLRFRKLSKDYYPIYKIWYVTSAMVMIQHPDDIKLFLSSKTNLEKTTAYNNLKMFLGTGLVVSKTSIWKQRRKIVCPAFSPAMLRINSGIVSKHAKILITCIKPQGDETIQHVVPLMKKFAIGIICDTIIGVDINELEIKGREKFIHSVDFISDVSLYRVIRPYIKDWMMNFLPIGKKQNSCIKVCYTFRDKVIKERRKYHESTTNQNADYSIQGDSPYVDINHGKPLIDILLSAEKRGLINTQDIGDEMITFISAGYDTTAITVSYALLLLAENKEIQELARAEVLEVINQSTSKILDREIEKLEYLERCVKESLRIFPTVPNIARTLSEGLQLNNYYIPANTEVVVNIYDLHRDPNYWPEPDKYDPDRFLPERARERHPFAYIPFSAGIRNCVGYKYGMMAIKNILAHILINFDLECIDKTADMKISLDFFIHSVHPMRLKFVKRNVGTE